MSVRNKLRLRWNLEGDWRNSHVTQPNSLPDGEWRHWIFSFNDGVTTLYKDGLSVFTGNDDQKSFSDRVVDVKFGWRDGYAGFQGRVDDLRIYKVALDDAAALLAYQGSGRLMQRPSIPLFLATGLLIIWLPTQLALQRRRNARSAFSIQLPR